MIAVRFSIAGCHCLWALFSIVSGAGASDEAERAAFDEANRLYAEEDFAGSMAGYDALAEDWISPQIFCNAGSAAYRAGDEGRAVLLFERALVLESTFAEAKQNLRFLRHRQGFLRFDSGPLEGFAGVFRRPIWLSLLVITGGFASLGGVSLVFLRVKPVHRALFIWSLVLGTLAAVVAGTGYLAKARAGDFLSGYIVVGSKVRALTAPNDSAGIVVALPAGSELTYLEQRGPWIYVDIPGGSRGWVRAAPLEKLWPYSPKLAE
jgi:hypothetical protein